MENHNTQVIILTEDMFKERKAAMSHDVVGTISKHCALNISSIYIIIKSLQFIFLSRLFNLYYYYVSTIYIIITSLQFILLLRLFNLYYYVSSIYIIIMSLLSLEVAVALLFITSNYSTTLTYFSIHWI